MRKMIWSLLIVFALYTLASAAGRDASTAEERKRFVTIAHSLEQAPLQDTLHADRDWGFKWLNDIPDIAVDVCTSGLGGFSQEKYQYANEISYQLVYSTAAFMIEHADKAKNLGDLHVAAVEGVLKAYGSILKTKPEAKSKALDDLLQKQHDGTLGEFVRNATKSCH
jgi:hypothetical protein